MTPITSVTRLHNRSKFIAIPCAVKRLISDELLMLYRGPSKLLAKLL